MENHLTMKNRMRFIGILLCLASLLAAPSPPLCQAGADPDTLFAAADRCRKALDGSPKKKRFRHHWLRCIQQYQKVTTSFPESPEAPRALYRAAGLYAGLYRYSGRDSDLDEAIALYRTLIERHKDHFLADDAQYRIGEIFCQFKKDPIQAYVEFLKIDVNFPSGDMRPKAAERLNELAEILSTRDGRSGKEGGHGAGQPARVPVKDIRHWSAPNYTRVVIDLKAPVAYEHHLLKADPHHDRPRRIYMDLKNARIPKRIDSTIPIESDLLQAARAAQHTPDTVRVVLDIKKIGGYRVFHLYEPFRIVVDVQGTREAGTETRPKTLARPRGATDGIRKEDAPDSTVSLARQLGLTVKRIVVDPGHGGKDPGCWIGGRHEKDITLSIARLLAQKLREKMGCEVFLTRDKDVFLSLEQRTAIANMKKADLFISLHVNAHKDQRIHGLETYFLNMATDHSAVLVAARENAASEKSISDLQAILNDLMLNTKISESSRLAHHVQDGMVGGVRSVYKNIKSLGVKQAPFYVLIGAEMPAVLVEVGFLTHPRERERLVNRRYQQQIANGICDGIRSYIEGIEQASLGG